MRIAVTGGSGKIGSAVVRELSAHGHEVTILDHRLPSESLPGVKFVFAELGHREVVQPALEAVEALCHLGEIPNVHAGPTPEHVFSSNTRAGSVVLQTAADVGLKRVVSTSSCQVYGMWENAIARPLHLPFDETHPVHPHNAYAAGKVANEIYARVLAERRGLSVAVFRLPLVLGASWDYSEDAVESLRKKPAHLDGFGTYVHTRDVARAYRLAIESSRGGFEIYQFSAREILSLEPLAQWLAEQHPDYPPLPRDWPPFASPLLFDKAKSHFGWEPRFNFLDLYRQHHGEP